MFYEFMRLLMIVVAIDLSYNQTLMSVYFEPWPASCVKRNVQKQCSLCHKDFKFIRPEHQCKRCLRAVCNDCASEKLIVYKQGEVKQMHRACKQCQEESREIDEFIATNRLQFGSMSPLGSKWMSRIDRRAITAGIDNRKHKKFTREVFGRMWDSYNYSLREFLGKLALEIQQDEVYRTVSDVVATVISVMPQEDLEAVAYLSIFMLCFSTPDKAPFLCLFLLQLKGSVDNEQGLLQAYLRAVGVNQTAQERLKEYLRHRGKRFLAALSVNSLSAKGSFDLLQRVFSKRKIDQVFISLALNLDMLRESIATYKDNLFFCDLLMVRLCTVESIAAKAKLPAIANVKSANFMKQRPQFNLQESSSFLASENSFMRQQGPLAASFSEGIRGNNKESSRMVFNPPQPSEPQRPLFQRRELKEESYIEDSFSMIDDINNPQHKNGKEGGYQSDELLTLMAQAEQKSNDSFEIKREIGSGQKPAGFPQLNLSLGEIPESIKEKRPADCQKCFTSNRTISTLLREIEDLKLQKAKAEEDHKREVKALQERLKANNNAGSNQINNTQKAEMESQIRRLHQSLLQYQQKEKDYQISSKKLEECRTQLKTTQQKLEESTVTIRLLNNKLESQSFSIHQPRTASESSQALRINQMLKQSLREKNQEIEQLSKQNKVIQYQLEQSSKERLQDKQKTELKQKVAKTEKEKDEILLKMKELSTLLMEMESEKLNLSEENFQLREMLRERGVVFSDS